MSNIPNDEMQAEQTSPIENVKDAPPIADFKENETIRGSTSVVRAVQDEKLVPKTRDEYIADFSLYKKRTAEAIIAMCRVIYEAHETLSDEDYEKFCQAVGLNMSSSSEAKFWCIGRAANRLSPYADKLPATWTSLYLLTQIPDTYLETVIKENQSLVELTGEKVKDLIRKAQDVPPIDVKMWKTAKEKKPIFGKLVFDKTRIDDIDYLAMKKAIHELELRLPVKFILNAQTEELWRNRREQRYEDNKRNFKDAALEPHHWEFGQLSNSLEKKRKAPTVPATKSED